MTRISNNNYSAQVIHGEYYPHIDGIRALAVLPVVLFHTLAALCPGGFAGVDVFFVISGYLITGGILRDLNKDRFTIQNFYYRRIRRIMPAYFAMIAGVFAAGCAIYYSQPLIYLGDTTIMGTLFSANIYFYIFSGGYFDPNIHGNPLLHLWSLSIEEQFYLFIPLLCAVIWRFRRRLIVPALALLAVLSLSGAIFAVLTGKQNSAFYLLHFRAWELLVGSLLAMLPLVMPSPSSAVTNRSVAVPENAEAGRAMLASLGVLLVGMTYVGISAKTPFPGLAALPPVVGTALLIRYGGSGWVSQLLSCRLFVAIGKISYSLYLWHWPVTVFWKYAVYDQVYMYDYVGMFLLSLLLGYLSWKFVELPVRTSPSWTMRRSFAFAASGMILLVAVGAACIYGKGWPNSLHIEANAMSGNEFPSRVVRMLMGTKVRIGSALGVKVEDPFRLPFGAHGDFNIGAPGKQQELLLVGDSHAGHLQYGFDSYLREKSRAGYVINRSNTFMFNIQSPETQYVLGELAKRPDVSQVVLASRWMNHSSHDPRQATTGLTWDLQVEEFARLVKSTGKAVFIVTDVPWYGYAPCDIAARMKIIAPRNLEPGWNNFQQSEATYQRMQGEVNRKLERVCNKTGAVFVPLHLALKQGDHYIAFDNKHSPAVPLYKDFDHLSLGGSRRAAQFIGHFLNQE